MVSNLRPRTQPNERVVVYEGFRGLDTTRSDITLDTGSNQALAELSGGYADEYGQLVRDPGYSRVAQSDLTYKHYEIVECQVFDEDASEVSFAFRNNEGIAFGSTRSHETAAVWPSNAVPSSFTFNGIQVYTAKALPSYQYDGFTWGEMSLASNIQDYKPAFGTSVQNRAVIGGIPLKPTEIHFSRTNQLAFYNDEEDGEAEAVTRAGFIDIQNLIEKAERIVGLAQFETSRLAVFTQDRMILYNTDPDIEQWSIDSSANVKVGTISHRTIQSAGTDLIFCSRNGVHTVTRSKQNGVLVFSTALSDRVKRLYRNLIETVSDKQLISAVWDQDEGHYHIFFPDKSSGFTRRLSLALNPNEENVSPKWSLTSFLNENCGSTLGGLTVFGTIDGLYKLDRDTDRTSDEYADFVFKTPRLWHGSISDNKRTRAVTIQAAGEGTIRMRVYDDEDNEIHSSVFQTQYVEDDSIIPDVPLSMQYERPIEVQYRGAQYEFEITEGKGQFFFSGFGVHLKGN